MRNLLFVVCFLICSIAEARPRRFVNLISGGGSSSSADAELVPYWSDGISVGNFSNSANWQELSGLTAGTVAANDSYMWIISDSPANMLAAVSKANAASAGVYTLETPPTYVDWEDIESANIGGVSYLYVFDFGNNGSSADSRGSGIDMRIFRILEPTINGSGGVIAAANRIEINAVFPGGNPPTSRDAECSIVDPATGSIYILIKRDATQKLYSLPHAASYSGTQTLTYEGLTYALSEARTQPLGATPTYCVDATINPSGTEIILKTYRDAYLFTRNPATQTIAQALATTPVVMPAYVGGGTYPSPRNSHPNAEPQGEGIAFDQAGLHLWSNSEYLTSEGATASRYPFFKYTRAAKAETVYTFQEGISSYAGTSDTYIWDTNPTTNYGGDATYVLDKAVGIETDQRKGLLKFDLSSIPTNFVVTGCKLEQYINTEGQGWTSYRMLVDWNESSTYNSLTTGVNDDNVEASSTESSRNGVNLDTIQAVTARDNILVSDCQAMITTPATNYGWLLESTDITGGDGVQMGSSEAVTSTQRPKLTIRGYVN
jgi:hypothetical protein